MAGRNNEKKTDSTREILGRPYRAGVALLGHFVLIAFVAVVVWGMEWLYQRLWPSEDPKLFDVIPLRYLFDAGELGIIGVFVVWGMIEAHKQYRS
jgi:hypothetical protein